jgi:16S rRNA (guanine(966)-N(2))-methyltransferase RsmD
VKKYIRIVAGQYRKTPIEVVDAVGLRPTPDRVRETLFNWLTHFWAGEFGDKRVLDLFAGSGALAFEAASRGVASVEMLEQDRAAVAAIQALKTRLRAQQVKITQGDALSYITQAPANRFDLIFLDPPFGKDWFEKLWLALPKLLEPDGFVYLEAERALNIPENFKLLRQDRAGVVHYHLVQFVALQK